MVISSPGAGFRSLPSFCCRVAPAARERLARGADRGGCCFLRRVRHLTIRVIEGDGVGVEGIQRVVRATVAEPVLFPPPAGHPVDHARGGQLILAARGEDVYLLSLVAAGDLPQVQHLALVLAAGDRERDAGVRDVIGAVAAVVPAPCHDRERVVRHLGGLLAGLVLAVGEQPEPGLDDLGEQVAGPAAPVKAQHRLRAVAADPAQVREQVLDLGGQRGGRLGHHHQHRVPGLAGDPGLLGSRSGVLHPRQVHLLHVPGAEVGAGMPVDVEESQVIRPRGSMMAGDGQLQVRGSPARRRARRACGGSS